jgi:hypothetical protein
MKALLRAAFVLAMIFPGAAQAQNVWGTPGSTCVPTNTTIASGLHLTGIASIKFAAGKTGTMVFLCPIFRFNNGTTSWTFDLTYEDSTATGPGAFVLAQLYRMPHGSATPVLLASVNSNTSGVATLNTLPSPSFNHTFDFEANNYWARVSLKRATTVQNAVFHTILLNGSI